jgi:predicted nucleic acid-binding protein
MLGIDADVIIRLIAPDDEHTRRAHELVEQNSQQ